MAEFYFDTNEVLNNIQKLNAGDRIYLSGIVYTARDAAHKRIKELMDNNQDIPFPLNNAFIYYAGPTPTPDGMAIGSCGPTTSSRMDPYTPRLLNLGPFAVYSVLP